MKTFIAIYISILLFISFTDYDWEGMYDDFFDIEDPILHVSECKTPEDIGDTLSTGESIYWDCDWEASYKAGNVGTMRNSEGVPTMLYRSLSH